MSDVKATIKNDAMRRYFLDKTASLDPTMYIEQRMYKQGDALHLADQNIAFDRPSFYVFIDEQPAYNWGHSCKYFIYDAMSGEFLKEIHANFPPFFSESPSETLELFRVPECFKRMSK